MSITERYNIIEENIAKACADSGRKREEINEAISLGINRIGENRVQELMEKYDRLDKSEIHLIGQLQTNKVKYIIDKVEFIHSLDRISLATEIDKLAEKKSKSPMKVLVEINIAGESTKSGIEPNKLTEFLDILTDFRYINPVGLMTVAPGNANEYEQEMYFNQMRELLEKGKHVFGEKFKELSMGMSRDYIAAIKNGATMIRLGTALFGERIYNLEDIR